MSLVNEMLSDLQSSHPTPASASSFVEPVKPNLFNKYILFIILLSTFVITYYLLFDYFKKKPQATTNTTSIKTKVNHENIKQKKTNKNLVQPISVQTIPVSILTPTLNISKIKKENIKPAKPHTTPSRKTSIAIIKPTTPPVIKRASLDSNNENKLTSLLQKWSTNQSVRNQEKIVEFLQKTNKNQNLWNKSLRVIIKQDFYFYKKILKISLNYHPKNASFLYLSAKNSFSENNYLQTLEYLDKIEFIKWNKNTYKLAALSSQKLNKHNQAVIFYLKILKNHENTGEMNMAIAISYSAINLKKEAVYYYKAAFNKTDLNKLQKQFIRQQIIVLQG